MWCVLGYGFEGRSGGELLVNRRANYVVLERYLVLVQAHKQSSYEQTGYSQSLVCPLWSSLSVMNKSILAPIKKEDGGKPVDVRVCPSSKGSLHVKQEAVDG